MKNVYRRQAGISLIELMIGLTIGLFILLGVVMVYVSSARSQATSEALARVQESGRFATYLMAREIRQAGFKYTCPGGINNLLDTSSSAYVPELFDMDNAVQGWADDAGTLAAYLPDFVRGDILQIKHTAINSGVTAKGPGVIQAATVNIAEGKSGIKAGTILMLADAYGCDLFQKTNNENSPALVRGGGGVPGNLTGAAWSHVYHEDMEILKFRSLIYYIGLGHGGQPALKQFQVLPEGKGAGAKLGRTVELVSGIEDMRLMYGLDTDNTGSANTQVDTYVSADSVSDWQQVVSVRVSLLTSSPDGGLNGVEQVLTWPFDIDGNGNNDPVVIPNDGRLRSLFTTTVAIRNRLP